MIHFSKSIVLSILVLCSVIVAVAWFCVRRVVSQSGVKSYEGYFAPVYSRDGQHVYFVERRVSGAVKQTQPTDLFFSSPRFDVSVATDVFSLQRLHVESGRVEELVRLSPSPLEGKHYEVIGSPFQVSEARLRFINEQQLEFNICVTAHQVPSANQYFSTGVWSESQRAAEISRNWSDSHCEMSGYDKWPLFGDSELMEVRGNPGLFPVAIVAYNHATNDVKVLVKSKEYDRLYPDGVSLRQIQQNSQRAPMEREQTVKRTHDELMQKYKAMGMSEIPAQLRTAKDMERLGYYPKTPTIVARRLPPAETKSSNIDKDALFSIAKEEMASGIFPDIEDAIASPGEEIEKDFTSYVTHRDYSTSARLNAFLQAGKKQFYVRYVGETYELTITRP